MNPHSFPADSSSFRLVENLVFREEPFRCLWKLKPKLSRYRLEELALGSFFYTNIYIITNQMRCSTIDYLLF